MDYIQSIIVGFIQGLTEFLPVSSSAHIVLGHSLYKLITGAAINVTSNEEIFFDIVVHLGTLGAVIIYFRNEILELLKAFFNGIRNTKCFTRSLGFVITASNFHRIEFATVIFFH